MVQRVVDNLPDGNLIVCHRSDVDPGIDRPFTSVPVQHMTEGAADTALLAAEHIDNDEPLLIANCDQLLDWDPADFVAAGLKDYSDGAIAVFSCPERDPKWSYVQCGDGGWISRVVEKDPISTIATCGVYLWRRGHDFVTFAADMIHRNQRVNGEFYIAPTYQLAIDNGWNIAAFAVAAMHGMGTPEDLEATKRELWP